MCAERGALAWAIVACRARYTRGRRSCSVKIGCVRAGPGNRARCRVYGLTECIRNVDPTFFPAGLGMLVRWVGQVGWIVVWRMVSGWGLFRGARVKFQEDWMGVALRFVDFFLVKMLSNFHELVLNIATETAKTHNSSSANALESVSSRNIKERDNGWVLMYEAIMDSTELAIHLRAYESMRLSNFSKLAEITTWTIRPIEIYEQTNISTVSRTVVGPTLSSQCWSPTTPVFVITLKKILNIIYLTYWRGKIPVGKSIFIKIESVWRNFVANYSSLISSVSARYYHLFWSTETPDLFYDMLVT